MTVSTTIAETSYAGNDVAVAFSTDFEFISNSHLIVTVINDTTGIETTKVLNVDYTVSGAGAEAGGTVTMGTAPATGETLTIRRQTTRTQESTLAPASGFSAAEVGDPLDRVTMLVQEALAVSDRGITVPVGETGSQLPSAASRKGKWAFFDLTTGKIIGAVAAPDTAAISAFAETFLDDTDLDSFLTTLDLKRAWNMTNSLQFASPTTGTSTAFVASTGYSFDETIGFDNLFRLRFHTNCGDNPTLTIDGIGPYPLHAYRADGQIVQLKANQIIGGRSVLLFFNPLDDRFTCILGTHPQESRVAKVKTADEDRTSTTTLAVDTDFNALTVYVGGTGGSDLIFEGLLAYNAGAGGIKFQIPTLSNLGTSQIVFHDSATDTATVMVPGTTVLALPGAATGIITIKGMLRFPGPNGSGLNIHWAQNSSNAAASSVLEGSYVKLRNILEY